ncbi:hypothetical protein [Maridesulfovibrio zosterae]|uniref:hypothetical protein n=1 Tax=Maridesulfovibrio zosterae TaxID=82171 RepID=UPI000426519E|nr:hypothetical protein [Maridesulfovibrio zosterae]
MNKSIEDVVYELNNITASLDFLSNSLECHDLEGREINAGGMAYLLKGLCSNSACVAELCWEIRHDSRLRKDRDE